MKVHCTLPCPDRRRCLRMLVLPMVLFLISMGWVTARSTHSSSSSEILLPLARGFADFDNHVKTLSEAVGMVTSRITSAEQTVSDLSANIAMFAEMEQNFHHFTARMCKVETYAASASNVSGSARSWSSVEHVDGSTAARSHGLGSSDNNRNTRRTLDIFSSPEDEHARSAVLFRFPCEQYFKGITKWITLPCEEHNMPAYNKTCQNSLQSRFGVSQPCFSNTRQMLRLGCSI